MIGSKVAKRYAKALFTLGQEEGRFERYGHELAEFAKFSQENAEFGQAIANPIFPVEDRRKILQLVLEKSNFTVVVKNFLNLLLDKNRMGAIAAITGYYEGLSDAVSGIARAEIVTARPMKGDALQRIERSLEALTAKKVRSEVREDRALIGGIVVKIGDLVLDGSVKTQLEGLKESF